MDEARELRALGEGDERALFEFLETYLDSSLILLSNGAKAGLVDRGEPLQGTYVACFGARGQISAVAAHYWNGNVALQGDAGLEQAARRAVELSGRAVRGLIGPWGLVERARQALLLSQARAAHDGREHLLVLALDELRVPALLERSDVRLRTPTEAESQTLLAVWRADYNVECLGAERTPELAEVARQEARRWRDSGNLWVLTVAEQVVAMTGFNSEARGNVQVGGVYTPPELRSRGFARAAVAASLQLARAERGAVRSVLFTSQTNQPACRAYAALGYRVVGEFGLVLF